MWGRNDPIVRPQVTARTPALPAVAAVVSSDRDVRWCSKLAGIGERDFRPLFVSRLHTGDAETTGFALAGPVIGAPYAVMVMETLVAWGATRLLFLGWCGALTEEVGIGDLILPTSAWVDEGTSLHYGARTGGRSEASPAMVRAIAGSLAGAGVAFREGSIWSTDGIYRETPEKVARFRERGALAVEMEVSALFTVGRHHRVDVGALLVVSDSLSGPEWRPGFGDDRFNRHRRVACENLLSLCRKL